MFFDPEIGAPFIGRTLLYPSRIAVIGEALAAAVRYLGASNRVVLGVTENDKETTMR